MRNQAFCLMVAFVLAGCNGVLPQESIVDSVKFQTYEDLMTAYAKIDVGKTRLADLAALGFDPKTTPNIEILSYIDIINRFMPTQAMTIQRLPNGVRSCIEAQDHCSAYVMHLKHSKVRHNGSVVPDLLEIERDTSSVGWSAEVVLLLRDDQVAYKVISSQPYLADQRDRSQPLGPLQDLGRVLTGGDRPPSSGEP